MEDAVLNAPTHQPFQEMQVADTSNANSALNYVGENCASSSKLGDPPELQSSSINPQRMKEDEPSSGKDHVQAQAEAAQSDASVFNDAISLAGNSQKSREGNLDGDSPQESSMLSSNLQDREYWIVDQVDIPKEPVKMSDMHKGEDSKSNFKGPTSEESAEMDHGLNMQSSDNSRAILNEELENAKGDENHPLSKVLINSEEVNLEEKREEPAEESGSADESMTGSRSSCITPSITKGTLSKDSSQPSVFLPNHESGQQQTNELVGDSKILPPSTTTGKGEVRDGFQNDMELFLDPSNQEWSDLDFGEATLISTNIEGWHRFDAEEVVTGTDYTPGADQRGIMWEQLLDDGPDSIKKDDTIHPLQLALPPPHKDSQLELASPRNPFMEELDRASSFAEEPWSLHQKEGLIVDEKAHGDPSSGSATITEGVAVSNIVNEQKTKLHLQSSTSLDFMEPFEAPSFMSLVDPKSHALFEASMPTYQAHSSGDGHENDEEKWVADFDLVAPSTQEITRSISMPRPGSDTPGQRPGPSVSFTVDREQEPTKKEGQSPSAQRSIAGFLSPKLSPIVQKVVDKVRSTPAAANGVINSVRQVMSPKASSKKSTSGSLLTRCMCW